MNAGHQTIYKPGQGRPRKDGMPNQADIRKLNGGITRAEEKRRLAAMLDDSDDAPPPKRGPGRPRKEAQPDLSHLDQPLDIAYDPKVMGETIVLRRELGIQMDRAKLSTEELKAQQMELKLNAEAGLVVSRMAVRDASARHHAALVQAMRMIPDRLEHAMGLLTPEAIEFVGREIDAALSAFSDAMSQGIDDL